nr:immunoglobulin light chain junction region [Macaca mulatta]MOX70176.1 immunoglobulin light chain junction region [Macaca mulatta]MOX70498.1 immunoglobulin light chain junction region [Macaca mulatta]MOX70605.1 immunoglobulin light chain junction region [Macaca mulatta]MOX71933.1 immunoglobulin light chain junction region [Macaca mulatta]
DYYCQSLDDSYNVLF